MSTETKKNFFSFLKIFDKFNISYKFFSFNAKILKKKLNFNFIVFFNFFNKQSMSCEAQKVKKPFSLDVSH